MNDRFPRSPGFPRSPHFLSMAVIRTRRFNETGHRKRNRVWVAKGFVALLKS
ncbi:MAG: hypothetical protein HYY18_06125 [Planctomycetes bacterium]|nr:hypothetical protein [Planctomycetota bacterium]